MAGGSNGYRGRHGDGTSFAGTDSFIARGWPDLTAGFTLFDKLPEDGLVVRQSMLVFAAREDYFAVA